MYVLYALIKSICNIKYTADLSDIRLDIKEKDLARREKLAGMMRRV